MKLTLWKAIRFLAVPFGYLLCGAAIGMVSFTVIFSIMPILVSLLITYLGFTEEATVAVVFLMGGVPSLLMAGLVGYGTVAFLRFLCRRVMETFRGSRDSMAAKIAKESGERLA